MLKGFSPRDVWTRHVWPRLVKWWGRLTGLPRQMEALEFGMILIGVVMACWLGSVPIPDRESRLAAAMEAACSVRVCGRLLWLNIAVAFVGFLEEVPWMRRWSSGVFSLFWLLTGAYLLIHLHGAVLLPRLFLLLSALCACVWTFVAQARIKSAYRHGGHAPGRLWWLTGVRDRTPSDRTASEKPPAPRMKAVR